jgi:hypothetical protein
MSLELQLQKMWREPISNLLIKEWFSCTQDFINKKLDTQVKKKSYKKIYYSISIEISMIQYKNSMALELM